MARLRWIYPIAVLVASVSHSALAQSAEATSGNARAASPADSEGLGEIVVTAQRREQNLLDVPVSVTAFNGAALERNHIVETRSLQALAPNLTLLQGFANANDVLVGLRGLGAATTNPNIDPTVGVYVDGVYYARSSGTNVALSADMSQVEVLRGPQGTLFGRNTIGGALNITTNQPTDRFEGLVKLGVGKYDQLVGTAVVNVPIIDDRLDLRLVYDHQQHDGYYKDTNPAAPSSELNNQNQNYYRATLKARLSDTLDVTLFGDHFQSNARSSLSVVNYFDPAIAKNASLLVGAYLCPRCTSNQGDVNPKNKGSTYDAVGTVNWDLGGASLKSITAYRHIAFHEGADIDTSPIVATDLIFSVFQHQFSQEFQLSGKAFDDRLDWISGVYYFKETVDNPQMINRTAIDYEFRGVNSSKSAFVQLNYAIVPELKLTAGVRYTDDHREASYIDFVNGACSIPTVLLTSGSCYYATPGIGFKYVPWTVGLAYKPDPDVLYYAKLSKGYRSGAFQIAGASTVAGFAPVGDENVLSYEAGTHQSLLNGHLQINASGFYARYNDIQQNLSFIPPGSPTKILILVNAGKAEIWGGELEATALIERLRLRGTVGLIHPKFTDGPYLGLEFTNTSKRNFSVSADYPVDLGFGTLDFHSGYAWQSAQYYQAPINTSTIPFSILPAAAVASNRQHGYGLLDANVSLQLERLPLTLTVWGANLTNKYFWTKTQAGSNGINEAIVGDPRTYGVRATYKF